MFYALHYLFTSLHSLALIQYHYFPLTAYFDTIICFILFFICITLVQAGSALSHLPAVGSFEVGFCVLIGVHPKCLSKGFI